MDISTARLSAIRKRRRRVWRQMAFFVFGASVVVMISMVNRDVQAIESCRAASRELAQKCQESVDQRGMLPARLPANSPRPEFRDQHYVYNAFYAGALAARGEAAICYCTAPHQLYLRRDGRHVIVFDGKKVRVEWFEEAHFRAQAEKLGVRLTQ